MKEAIFFDVDTQFDFMHKENRLYIPDAGKIIPNLKKITEFAKINNISVAASIDNHSSKGHKKIPETDFEDFVVIPNKVLSLRKIAQLKKNDRLLIEKQQHNVFSNPNLKPILGNAKKAYVYGVATEYCVKEAVLGLASMGIKLFLIEDAVMPISKEEGKKTLELFKKKGVKFLTTEQLLSRKVL